ncbi:MAG: GNAT family N-acetyltransferase [Candidatus Promineifilaceae bacterium]
MNNLPWLVRAPVLADVLPLAAIATAVSQPHTPINPEIIRWSMDQLDGRFWTITQQAQPIGYAALLPLPGLPHLFELTGGIDPPFQRQGAGSYLWHTMRQTLGRPALATGAGPEITYTVPNLDTPTARFLRHHQFTLEHEEWTMRLTGLPGVEVNPPHRDGQLMMLGQDTAVRTLPALYERCFVGTPWFQAYTPAEVAATWEPGDQLWTLTDENKPVGFAWLRFPESGAVEIEPIGIVREKQGMGYGRFLLTSLLQLLQKRGIETVSLGVWANNATAVRLYQSVGFHYVSSSYSLTYIVPAT